MQASDYEHAWAQLSDRVLQDLRESRSDPIVQQSEQLLQQIKSNLDDACKPNADLKIETKKFLLPIVELAHIYESNGIPAEHAEKLSIIFANFADALDYLNQFAKSAVELERQRATRSNATSSNANLSNLAVVHDACLFNLPQEAFDFKTIQWQKLIKENMQNPEFRSLLAGASELKDFIEAKIKEKIEENKITTRNLSKEEKARLNQEHQL